MHRILVDHARRRLAIKRGGDLHKTQISDTKFVELAHQAPDEVIEAVDEALKNFAEIDKETAMLVELRFFVGLTMQEAGQLLGITQRTICVINGLFGGRFSPRKLIPVNAQTLGDHLLLKRIQANLSQPEVAAKMGVTVRKVKAWEYDQIKPSQSEWPILASTLNLGAKYLDVKVNH
jgi:hypothetical protein